MINEDDIISELNLKSFGSLGWLHNEQSCPFCGKKDKWGLRLNKEGGVFHCWKCSFSTSLFNFLKKIDRIDLARGSYTAHEEPSLSCLEEEGDMRNEDPPIISLPIGSTLVKRDSYLDSRNFLPQHYDEFSPHITTSNIEGLKDYIIFEIRQNYKLIAWLARSKKSKEWHKKNLEESKKKNTIPSLRYRNSHCDFSKIIGGYDTIKDNCECLFIVEGLFDKINLDRLLDTHNNNICVVFTFGKSISGEQINLLRKKKPQSVVLMYDEDSILESKKYGIELSHYFETYVARIDNPEIDPGNMEEDYLQRILSELRTPIEFSLSFFSEKLCEMK